MNLLIAGDFCPQKRIVDLLEDKKFNYVLGEVKPIVAQSDYSIVNLECSIISGSEKPISKLGPNFGSSFKAIEAVKWAGFNCVTLANNHFLDYGDEGVKYTLESCHKIGLDTVGGVKI